MLKYIFHLLIIITSVTILLQATVIAPLEDYNLLPDCCSYQLSCSPLIANETAN